MAIPVPSYLEHIAKIEKSKKDYAEFSLACPCGSDGFIVYKNYFSAEDIARAKEWEKRYDDYWRRKFFCGKSYFYEKDKETGKLYERRMFLSIINVGRYCVDDRPDESLVVIKAKCKDCGKEYIIFDNRIHGYDGWSSEKPIDNSYADVNFKPEKAKGLDEEHFQVFLKIWNDTSLERFIEATGIDDVTHEQYSDAFGYIKITIYSLTRLGKEKLLLAEETR